MNELQSALLEMLVDVDSALRKDNVFYSLDGGTALGAVRHKGFIPWDDDIDIFIREDQEKEFRDALRNNLPPGKYYLQEPLSVDWANSFYKIKLNHSTGIEKEHIRTRMHQGLFIDVFVARAYPNTPFRRRIYKTLTTCQKGIRVLGFRNYGRPRRDILQSFLFWSYRSTLWVMTAVSGRRSEYLKLDYPTDMYVVFRKDSLETVDSDFEGHSMKLISDYDRHLTDSYGDYMTPPPENERVGEHIFAFSRTEDYKDWLKRYFDEHPETK